MAYAAAVASECASFQGRFEPFADLLFETQDSVQQLGLAEIGRRVGIVDLEAFKECEEGSDSKRRVDADIAAGISIGISGTPGIVLGRRMIVGAAPVDTILAFIREAGLQP
jgi:protein-disulfide isomerase